VDAWYQLWVRPPSESGYNVPGMMRRVDEHLQAIGGVLHVPGPGPVPVAEPDGTYEVRVLFGDPGFVRFVLTDHYGLDIVREEKHDGEE
jgi:hypothetical protein